MDVHGVQSFRRAGQTLGPTHWGRRQRSVFGSFLLISPAGAVESDQKPPRAPSISSGLCPSPTLETSGIWNPMFPIIASPHLRSPQEARAVSSAWRSSLEHKGARSRFGVAKAHGPERMFSGNSLAQRTTEMPPHDPFFKHRYNYVPSMEC